MDAPEPEGLFTEQEFVALQTGIAQNLTQEALKQFNKKFEQFHELLEAQKKLVPIFDRIETNIEDVLQKNNLFEERLVNQEKKLESYSGILNLFEQINQTFRRTDLRLEELAAITDSLKEKNQELVNTLLENNEAWEQSFANVENFVEKSRISPETLDLITRTSKIETQSKGNTQHILTLQQQTTEIMVQIAALQKSNTKILTATYAETESNKKTFENLENKIRHLERQHTFFKWIGGGITLALVCLMWFYTHNTNLSQI